MIAKSKMIGVLSSVSDWLGQGREEFWQAAHARMSGWPVQAIGAALEHEVSRFVGVGWHRRCPQDRRCYRNGYRPRRFIALGREVTFRMPRVRMAGFRSLPPVDGCSLPGQVRNVAVASTRRILRGDFEQFIEQRRTRASRRFRNAGHDPAAVSAADGAGS